MPGRDSAATRCDTKGCPNTPTEKVPDVKLPHVVYDLCASCATGMRALQALPEGSLIDARSVPPLTFEPLAEHPAAQGHESWCGQSLGVGCTCEAESAATVVDKSSAAQDT